MCEKERERRERESEGRVDRYGSLTMQREMSVFFAAAKAPATAGAPQQNLDSLGSFQLFPSKFAHEPQSAQLI